MTDENPGPSRRPAGIARVAPAGRLRPGSTGKPTTRAGGALALDLVVGLTSVGNRAYSVAVVAVVYDGTHSASLVGLAAAIRYLAGLAASALSLPLVVRVRPRRLLVAVNVVSVGVALGLAAAVNAGASFAVIIVLSGLLRAATSPTPVTAAGILPRVLGGRDLADASRRQNAVDKLALFVGPALGGVLLLAVHPAAELVLVACLFAAAAIATIGLPALPTPVLKTAATHAAPDGAAERTDGAGRRVGPLAWLSAFTVAAGLLYGLDTVLFAVIASERLGLGSSGYGLLFAGLGAGSAIGALVARAMAGRPALAGLLVAALAVYALPTTALPWVSSLAVALPLEAVRGFGALLVDVLAFSGLQRILLPARVPRVVATVSACVAGAVAAGALLAPLLLSAFGLRTTLILAGTVAPAAAFLALPSLSKADGAVRSRSSRLAPRTRILASLGLLEGVSMPTLEMLAAGLQDITVPEGTVLVREGESSDDLYIMIEGGAVASAADGRMYNVMGPGQWFGEIAALTGSPRSATVTTTTQSRLFRISGDAFHEALVQLPPSGELLDSAAARLSVSHPTRVLGLSR